MESSSRTLKYIKIYTELKRAILSGQYLSGSFLPSENELCACYNVSRTSVRKAISMLEQEKLVETSQGRGTEVLYGTRMVRPMKIQVYQKVSSITSEYLCDGSAVAMNSIVDIVTASREQCSVFHLPGGSSLYRIRRLKVIGHTPYSYLVSYVPCILAPGLEKHNGQVFVLYDCLKSEYGIESTSVVEKISCDIARFLESNLLAVSVGSPLILTKRTAMCGDTVMEYTETWLRPDVYQISVSMKGGINYADSAQP